jgi:hypothetical protein
MTTRTNRLAIYSIIFLCLFAAFLPVILTNNYLRQDDLIMWQIWPGMKIRDTDLFFMNTVKQLVRPLCLLTFYITDLVSLTIHNAVYIRMLGVLILASLGVLLYRWQLFFNNNRLLAATFAICAFTLPPYQFFAATQNYFLILVALLLTFGALFYWYRAWEEKTINKRYYFWLANLLFFASCLEYPLSSMYAWVLLGICYLNMHNSADFFDKRKFFYHGCRMTLLMMGFYYICIILVHKLYPVNYLNFRSAVVDKAHIFPRLLKIFSIMSWHSNMWWWKSFTSWKNSPILVIYFLFGVALWLVNVKKGLHDSLQITKNIMVTLAIVFLLFFMAYSPVMATPEIGFTFRYAICTMPFLLYISFWSVNEIAVSFDKTLWNTVLKTSSALLFIGLTIYGIGYANLMIGDGIVGPNEHDFKYLEQQITAKVIPLLKQHKKVTLHLIDCDNGSSKLYPGKTTTQFLQYMALIRQNYHYPANIPTAFEYSMRSCQFLQFPLSATIHILKLYGYSSNYNRLNDVIWNNNEIIVKDTPWGDLIVNGVDNPHLAQLKYAENKAPVLVTIDLRNAPPYQHMEFYNRLPHY